MPSLIVSNGPLGKGKSSLAKRYGKDRPLTLVLDIDEVWSMLSERREQKEQSARTHFKTPTRLIQI